MRARSRWLGLFAAAPLSAVLAASCTDDRGSLGDDCLKDQDCVSGVCAQLTCAAGPTYLDSEAPEGPDAEGAEGSLDGSTTAEASGRDVASDTPVDATVVQQDAGAGVDGTVASAEASVEASVEASLESGADGVASAQQDAEAGTVGADAATPPDAAQDAVADVALDAHPDGADE
jgi:hypothetical protein